MSIIQTKSSTGGALVALTPTQIAATVQALGLPAANTIQTKAINDATAAAGQVLVRQADGSAMWVTPAPAPAPAPPPPPVPAPAFTAQAAPAGVVGAAYSYTFLASNTLIYALSAGSLPAGLSLNALGVLSGTPTTAATTAFTVAAIGLGGNTPSVGQSIAIAPAPVVTPAPAFIAQTAPPGTVGVAYSYQFAATYATSYAVASGTLPAGLVLSATGLLSGTPTTAATSAFTVAATGVAATTPSTAQSVAIAAAPVTVVAPTISTQPAAQSVTAPAVATFSVTATTGGGTLAYQWQRSNDAGSTWTNVGSNASTYTTAATMTSDTGARFRVLVSNSGFSVTSNAVALTVAAAAADTRARFVSAPANAYAAPASLLASMAVMSGASNGSRVGSFNLTTTVGNYGWIAVAASGAPAGVVMTDTSGFPGGWSGAGLAGPNTGSSPNPSTVSVAYTDGNGSAWKFFRQDYPNGNPSPGMAWTVA